MRQEVEVRDVAPTVSRPVPPQRLAVLAMVAALALAPLPAAAAPAASAASFLPPTERLTSLNEPFGGGVAISGDTAAVSGVAFGQAVVLVFARSSTDWSEEAQLADPADAGPGSLFGSALALSGDTLAVGAGAQGAPVSSVYIYVRSQGTWSLQAHLQPPQAAGRGFGSSLALAGDLLVAGVPGPADGSVPGAAFVFARTGSTWTRQAVLEAEAPSMNDGFGRSVAVAHQTVVVGGENEAGFFERQGGAAWARAATFHGASAGFGAAVAASNQTAAVTDPLNQVVSLFIHTRQGWTHEQDVAAPAGAAGFGSTVALSLDTLVVGAPDTSRPAAAQGGAVYVFDRVAGIWRPDGAYRPTAASASDRFGSAVAVSLHTAVVGSVLPPQGAWLLENLDNP